MKNTFIASLSRFEHFKKWGIVGGGVRLIVKHQQKFKIRKLMNRVIEVTHNFAHNFDFKIKILTAVKIMTYFQNYGQNFEIKILRISKIWKIS